MKIISWMIGILLLAYVYTVDIPSTASNPLKRATKADLQKSYNEIMQNEQDPTEKKKMDSLMENLAGIKSPKVNEDLTLKPQVVPEVNEADAGSIFSLPEIKTDNETDDRKLIKATDYSSLDNHNSDLNMQSLSKLVSLDPTSNSFDSQDYTNKKMDRDMMDMKDNYTSMSSAIPDGHSMELQAEMGNDDALNTGIHQATTNAFINRMDQQNQEKLNEINKMDAPLGGMSGGRRRAKRKGNMDIKKMLKGYDPALVKQFMPELKDRMNHKIRLYKIEQTKKRKLKKLRMKLEKEKKRERRREKRRKRARIIRKKKMRKLRLKQWKKHHHHHHHHHKKIHHYFNKNNKTKQLHALKVMKNYIHRHAKYPHYARSLIEEDPSNKNIVPGMVSLYNQSIENC